MKRLLPIVAALTLAITACLRPPEGIPDKHELAQLMAEMEYLQVTINEGSGAFSPYAEHSDTLRRELFQTLLSRYGLTQEQYDSTLSWYAHHLNLYVQALEEADSILADSIHAIDRRELLAREAAMALADTTQIWDGPTWHRFSAADSMDYLTFTYPRGGNWAKGDLYKLSFRLKNAPDDGITIRLIADYNGKYPSTDVIQTVVSSPGFVSLPLQSDSNKIIDRLYGFISLPSAPGQQIYIDSISLSRQAMDRPHYRDNRVAIRFFFRK